MSLSFASNLRRVSGAPRVDKSSVATGAPPDRCVPDILHFIQPQLQAITFVAASFGTTSMAAAIALYYLAQHKEWQDRCYAEARQVLSQGGDLDLAAVKRLNVIDMCFKESQRLTPSVRGHVSFDGVCQRTNNRSFVTF